MCYKEQRGRKSASHIEGTRETKNQRILNLLQWIRELRITLWPHFMWVTCIVISPRRCFSRSFHQLGLYSRYASVVIWLPDVRSVMLMLTSSNRLMVSIMILYFIISFWVRCFRLKKKYCLLHHLSVLDTCFGSYDTTILKPISNKVDSNWRLVESCLIFLLLSFSFSRWYRTAWYEFLIF